MNDRDAIAQQVANLVYGSFGLLLLCLVMSLTASESSAQNTSGESVMGLPDLDPQVMEITGDVQINLPGLQRQPLIGFNPPPTIIENEANALGYQEAYRQAPEELPPSPAQPPQPGTYTFYSAVPASTWQLSVDGGRFANRNILWQVATDSLNPTTRFVHASLAYEGSDGIALNGKTYNRHNKINVTGLSRLNRDWSVAADVSGSAGVVPVDSTDQDRRIGGASIRFKRDRGTVNWGGNLTVGFTANRLNADQSSLGVLKSEDRVALSFATEGVLAGPVSGFINLRGGGGWLTEYSAESGAHFLFSESSFGVKLRLNRFLVEGGATILWADANIGEQSRSLYFLPSGTVRLPLSPTLSIRGTIRPSIRTADSAQRLSLSPVWRTRAASLAPSVTPFQATAVTEMRVGKLFVTAGVEVVESTRDWVFEQTDTSFMVDVLMERTRTFSLIGDAELFLRNGTIVRADAIVRSSKLVEDNVKTPYVAPIEAGVTGNIQISSTLALQVNGRFFGERTVSRENRAAQAGAHLRTSAILTWHIAGPISVRARAEQLIGSAEDYWRGYYSDNQVLAVGVSIRP